MPAILARDVMTRDVATVTADVTLDKFIKLIQKRQFSGCPVVDKSGKAVGLVSQNDVLRALAILSGTTKLPKNFDAAKRKAASALLKKGGKGLAVKKFLAQPVSSVMTPRIEGCRPDASIADVCDTMSAKRIHRVVVLDEEGKPAGLISATDLVRKFGETLKTPATSAVTV